MVIPAVPEYRETFGDGVIVFSDQRLPARTSFDGSMYDFRDKKWYLNGGPGAQMHLRVLLPKGRTMGSYVRELKAQNPENLPYHVSDLIVIRFWPSHDSGGDSFLTGNHAWPHSLADIPKWTSPYEVFMNADEDSTDTDPGADWEDNLRSALYSYLNSVRPGDSLYALVQFAYEYKTPAGAVETKWDPEWNKWVQVTSSGLIGYVYSEPIAAETVEFK